MLLLRALCLAAPLLVLAPAASQAQVYATWGGCSAPEFSNENWSAGDHVLTVYVTGVGGTYDASSFTLVVADRCSQEGRYLPDAWRFEPGGCQEGRLRVAYPATANGCGDIGLGGISVENVTAQIVQEFLTPRDTLSYPAIVVRVDHAFAPTTFDPAQRYVLAQIHFDMSSTVADAAPSDQVCGCGSTQRGLWITSGRLEGPDGGPPLYGANAASWNNWFPCVIDPFARKTAGGATIASDPSCLTTATRAQSWGGIKGMYR